MLVSWNRVRVVGVGTRLGAAWSNFRSVRGRGKRFSPFQSVQTDPGVYPAPYAVGTGALYLAGNATGT